MPKNTNSLINIYHPPPLNFWGCGNMQSNNHKNHPVGGTATVQHLTRTNKNKILCSRFTPHRMTAAFTLVELAIVLVIIGLVIGGVFVGQDLIYSAQLRATMQDIEKYKTAVNTFKTKYNCIPGDCPNAYDYFGSACGKNGTMPYQITYPSYSIFNSDGFSGCNGNGNGILEGYNSQGANQEEIMFWKHLALAGLISGKYTGNPQTGWRVTDVNSPPARFGNTVYAAKSSIGTHLNLYGKIGSFFQLSGDDPASTSAIVGSGFMTAQQAFAMDTKFDDGIPSSGSIIVGIGTNNDGSVQAGCVANWNWSATSTTYLLNNTNSTCTLYFPAGF